MMAFLFVVLTFFVPSLPAIDHEFYVSVIEVSHSEQTQTVRFKCRIFSDDLQTGLQSEFDLASTPPLQGLCTDQKDHLTQFFSNHVTVAINGIDKEINALNCSSDGDVHTLEWQVDSVARIYTLKLKADYLMDVYPGQTQMVQFSSGEQKRTLRLRRNAPSSVIDLRN
jgi:hypothetical protein